MEEEKKRYCNSCCREVPTIEKKLESGPHYSFHTCVVCGKHLGFGKKPENGNKRPKNKYTAEDIGLSYCQICLRPKTRLGSRGVLEVHHVIEIQDGGEDTPTNLMATCTSCHRLIHHQRKYLNRHLSKLYSMSDLQADMDKNAVPKGTQEIMLKIFLKRERIDADDNS